MGNLWVYTGAIGRIVFQTQELYNLIYICVDTFTCLSVLFQIVSWVTAAHIGPISVVTMHFTFVSLSSTFINICSLTNKKQLMIRVYTLSDTCPFACYYTKGTSVIFMHLPTIG